MIDDRSRSKKFIDKINLLRAGWNVDDLTMVVKEFDIFAGLAEGLTEPRTEYNGHQFSDYVLWEKTANPWLWSKPRDRARMPHCGEFVTIKLVK